VIDAYGFVAFARCLVVSADVRVVAPVVAAAPAALACVVSAPPD
jgi:hypothetical protein